MSIDTSKINYIYSFCLECNPPPPAPTYLRPRSDSFFKVRSLPPIPDPPHYARPRSGSFFKVIPPVPEAPHYSRPRSGSFFNL